MSACVCLCHPVQTCIIRPPCDSISLYPLARLVGHCCFKFFCICCALHPNCVFSSAAAAVLTVGRFTAESQTNNTQTNTTQPNTSRRKQTQRGEGGREEERGGWGQIDGMRRRARGGGQFCLLTGPESKKCDSSLYGAVRCDGHVSTHVCMLVDCAQRLSDASVFSQLVHLHVARCVLANASVCGCGCVPYVTQHWHEFAFFACL